MKRTRPSSLRGFTLIELLVVIAIIGILASIIIASLSGARSQGRDAKRISDIRSIELALETYYSDNLHYPCDIYTNPAPSTCQPGFFGTYMPTVPKDPLGTHYFYSPLDTGSTSLAPNYYHLGALLENSNNSGLAQDAAFSVGTYAEPNNGSPFNAWNAKFSGLTNCGASDSAPLPKLCYDVVPGS